MDYSVENTVANNLINLGKKRLSTQLIISVNRLGQVQLKGNLDKKVALAKLKEIVQQEDARAREWLPDDLDSFPLFPLPLPEVLRNGYMAKSAAAAAVSWMLRKTGGKLGRDKFPLWFFPVNKENLVYTSGLVSKLPDTFTLNMILEWSDMAGCSMSHGSSGSLKPASGVTNHLSFIKIVLNIIFLVVGHDPLTWHRATAAPSTGPPPARTPPALATPPHLLPGASLLKLVTPSLLLLGIHLHSLASLLLLLPGLPVPRLAAPLMPGLLQQPVPPCQGDRAVARPVTPPPLPQLLHSLSQHLLQYRPSSREIGP